MDLWLLILMIGIAFLALVLKIIGYMCTVKDIQSMSSWWWFVFMYILRYHYSFPDSHVDIERNRTNNASSGTHSNANNSSPYIISMPADEVRSIPRNDSDLPPSYCQVEERPPSYEHYQRQNKLDTTTISWQSSLNRNEKWRYFDQEINTQMKSFFMNVKLLSFDIFDNQHCI